MFLSKSDWTQTVSKRLDCFCVNFLKLWHFEIVHTSVTISDVQQAERPRVYKNVLFMVLSRKFIRDSSVND